MSLQDSFKKYCDKNGINPEGQLAQDDIYPAFAAGYRASQQASEKAYANPLGRITWLAAWSSADMERDELIATRFSEIGRALGKFKREKHTLAEDVAFVVAELRAQEEKCVADFTKISRALAEQRRPGMALPQNVAVVMEALRHAHDKSARLDKVLDQISSLAIKKVPA